MAKKDKDSIVKKSFKYKKKNEEYTLQLKRRNWWWLLLLLPLLLFVKCSKDISVSCVEPGGNISIAGQTVVVEYQAHYLLSNWHFFASESIRKEQITDETGTTVFRDLPCSVFSYLFYCLQDAVFNAQSDCYVDVVERHNFHYTKSVELEMYPRREDVYVKLLDKETKDPLPDGKVIYKYVEQGKECEDSAFADPAGIVTLPQMRYCSVINVIHGSCYGYADTLRKNIPCQKLLVPNDSMALELRPLKEKIYFFVKNKDTREPIPGAECQVTLLYPNGRKDGPHKVTTSIDGRGVAVYENAFVRATISITAQKPPHYRDSVLTGGPWVVKDFIEQDEETRTIWLSPLSFMQEFVNVDSINGDFIISGVKNKIVVTHPDGARETFMEVSNSNGVFPISATEDDQVEIISVKEPCYKTKRTFIPKFKDANKKIPMEPVMVTLDFRTVSDKQPMVLVPKCNLQIIGSQSGSLKPTDSGQGKFEVMFRRCESLSITASKKDFATNSTSVQRRDYDYLSADKKRRDIPMKPVFSYQYRGNNKSHTDCYDLKVAPASFTFTWNTCPVCTMIIVKDGNGNELGRYGNNNPSGYGSGLKLSEPTGSVTLSSPTRQICVDVQDSNEHNCEYTISSK